MQTPHDPRHPFDTGAGQRVDPSNPWGHGAPASFEEGEAAPPGRDTKDPGSPTARAIAWVLVAILFCLTFTMTQCEGRGAAGSGEAEPAPDSEQSVFINSIFIKLGRAFEGMEAGSSAEFVKMLDDSALHSDEPIKEELRAAIVVAELSGSEGAIERLDRVQKQIDDERVSPASKLTPEKADEMSSDVTLLRAIYGGNVEGLTDDERESLVAHHGRLGRIALTFGKPPSDPVRAELVEGGGVLIAVLFGFFGLLLLVIPASIACAIIALVRMSRPTVRVAFVPPTPGGSIYLEMLAVFLFAFILLKLAIGLIAAALGPDADTGTLMTIALIAQWPVALVAFWPLLRGVSLAEHARRVGWTRGKGIIREIGAGIFGYLAGLPLLVVAFVITVLAMFLQQAIETAMGKEPTPPSNPILELATSGGLVPFLLFALATIWAPFTEETIFRGSLFRHLRSRRGMLISAMISALFFGLIHPYSVVLMLPVITLGFNFALMREWRGSLIAPITAHALHNGMIMTLVVVVLSHLG